MTKNGFTFSPDKTSLCLFTARHRIDLSKFYIQIYGETIKASTSTRYLGVLFEPNLSWGLHVQHLLNKASTAVGLIRTLKYVEGCNDVKSLLHVTRALVRSRLSYGQEAFFAAAPSTLHKLQAKECSILRIVLGLPKGTPQDLVYREAGWLPLERERELRCAQYVVRAQAVENSTSEEIQIDFDNTHNDANISLRQRHHTIAERNLSIANYVENISNTAGVVGAKVDKWNPHPFPPWQIQAPNFITDYGPVSKQQNPQLCSVYAKEIVHEYQNHLQIFTDGSKQMDGHVGCAFAIPALKITKKYRLENDVSIFSAELQAIYLALDYLSNVRPTTEGRKIVILTDSRSALEALQNCGSNRRNTIEKSNFLIHQLIQTGSEVTLAWIPSHMGIRGNEMADTAAKEACSLDQVTVKIGHTVSELCSKLSTSAKQLHANDLKNKATIKGWFDGSFDPNGVHPGVHAELLPLFYRLRTQSLRFSFAKPRCPCSQMLTFQHLFTCPIVNPILNDLQKFDIVPTPSTVLCKHPVLGWKIAVLFVKKLTSSEVGALV
jgi:ribonuclease HI